MQLTEQQRNEFDTQGYVNLGPLFDVAELAEIGGEYDRLVTFEGQTLGNASDGVFPYRAMLNFRSPALRRFINHPTLMELVAQLLGPDVRFWWDQGINKAPGSGSFIPWHQDNGYQGGQVPAYLTLWLALDASNADNGGLFVIPGSHRGGDLPHTMQGVHAVIAPDLVDATNAIPLDAAAGDVLLFSSLLVHQTVGNVTKDRQRRAWVVQYARADVTNAATGAAYDDRAWVLRDGAIVDPPWSERRFDMRGNGSNAN